MARYTGPPMMTLGIAAAAKVRLMASCKSAALGDEFAVSDRLILGRLARCFSL